MKVDLRDCFEAFDRDDPYHLCAAGELYSLIRETNPEILDSETDWFQTWKWGGKRDLRTGEKLNK